MLDKCYYAAKITKRDLVQTGKWTVMFEDGQSRSLVEEFILPVSLLNKNQPILVLNENLSEGRPGIVIGYSRTKTLEQVRNIFKLSKCIRSFYLLVILISRWSIWLKWMVAKLLEFQGKGKTKQFSFCNL